MGPGAAGLGSQRGDVSVVVAEHPRNDRGGSLEGELANRRGPTMEGRQSGFAHPVGERAGVHGLSGSAGGGRYGSAWQIVCESGRWWRPAPFPRGLGRRRGRRAQDCYRQAARLAWAAVEDLVYVEGFADPGIGTVLEHAWCADAAGTVVDPSWHDTTGDAYLGIPITLDYRARLLGSRPRRLRSDSVLDPPRQS